MQTSPRSAPAAAHRPHALAGTIACTIAHTATRSGRKARVGISIGLALALAGATSAATTAPSAAATPTTKRATSPTGTAKAGANTAPTTRSKVGTAKAKSTKAAAPLKPGTPFVGWDKRGADDWPARNSALVLVPSQGSDTIVVYQGRGTGQSIALRSGQSVSGKLGMLVVGEVGGWWKVLMPVRPNGTIGWVQKGAARATVTTNRVVVDLAKNSLQLLSNGEVIRTERIASGTGGTPTPSGLFFIKAIAPQKNPNGGRGPYVLVLSGFSDVLFSFAGGQGAVGIHGTSAPGKIGQNVSNGCIRVTNETITDLAESLSPGTPVEILKRSSDSPKTRWDTPTDLEQGSSGPSGGPVGVGRATTTVGTGGDAPNSTAPSADPTTTVSNDGQPAAPPVTGIS